MGSLPTLRILIQPAPGFGLDARLPMGKRLRCYLSAEAYIHGGSTIIFGLEPAQMPWLRVQVAPCTRVSLRVPVAQVSEFKWAIGGGSVTIYNEGVGLRPKFGGWNKFWESVRGFVGGIIEVEHKNTLLGSFLDGKQRKALREALREAGIKNEERRERRKRERAGLEEVAPLDPRRKPDAVEKLRRALREKYGDQGIVRAGKGKEELLKELEKRMMTKGLTLHGAEREESEHEVKQQ